VQSQFAKDLLLATFTNSQFNARRFFESSQIEQDKFLGEIASLAECFEEGDLKTPDQGPLLLGDEEADISSSVHLVLEQTIGASLIDGTAGKFLDSLNDQGLKVTRVNPCGCQ